MTNIETAETESAQQSLIRTVRANNQTAETESANVETADTESTNIETAETISAQRSLRRSKRNISLVSYSLSSKSDLSSESASSFAPSLDSIPESIMSDSSLLRRSKRTQKRKIVFDNSDNLIKKSRKRRTAVINESLERLIRPPSLRTQQNEREETARQISLDARRKEEQRQDEEWMSRMEQVKQKRKNAKEFSKKIKEKADQLRNNLSEKSIKIMFRNNL